MDYNEEIDWEFPDYGYTTTDKAMLERAVKYAALHNSGGDVRVYAIATDKRGNILAQNGNTYLKSHPKQKHWCFMAKHVKREFLHAETRTLIQALKSGKEIAKLYVARVDKSGKVKDSKPCEVCSFMIATEFPHLEVIWSREK